MRSAIIISLCASALAGCLAASAAGNEIEGKRHLVTKRAMPDGGALSFFVGRWAKDTSTICLEIERRFGPGEERRPDSSSGSCGFPPPRRTKLVVAYDVSYVEPPGGETVATGIAPVGTAAVRVRFQGGRTVKVRVYPTPRDLPIRAKLFVARVAGTTPVTALRALDRTGRSIAYTRLTPPPTPPS